MANFLVTVKQIQNLEESMKTALFLIVVLFTSIDAGAFEASLLGSKESMKRQNEMADKEKLTRIVDDAMLERMKKRRFLVEITENDALKIDPKLDPKSRWVRPWTKRFLEDASTLHYVAFGKPFTLSSGTRTIQRQKELQKTNANASKISAHPTGSVIDLTKIFMRKQQIAWMQRYLLIFEKLGLIEATEEHEQSVFHVMVFKHYK
ncbi:hypothetical protein HYT00_03225 [Candidatus Giovannonibacteria bacterium]|nr:hypothetical protein [Candidatus Giovannonibacteria bacterium]